MPPLMTIPIATIVSFMGTVQRFGETIMRRHFLLMTLLLFGAGCQGLHDRMRCRDACTEPCPASEKPKEAAKPPERAAAPAPPQDPGHTAAVAVPQEVLLVPRMVYMPFVAANPTGVARMSPNMTVMPPAGAPGPNPPPAGAPPPSGAPAPPPPPSVEEQMLDMCKKLNQRLDCMERCIKDRNSAICPPSECVPACPQPLFPLFRRPLFNRAEPIHCDPHCATMQDCAPIIAGPPGQVQVQPPGNVGTAETLRRMPTPLPTPGANSPAPVIVIP